MQHDLNIITKNNDYTCTCIYTCIRTERPARPACSVATESSSITGTVMLDDSVVPFCLPSLVYLFVSQVLCATWVLECSIFG